MHRKFDVDSIDSFLRYGRPIDTIDAAERKKERKKEKKNNRERKNNRE